MPYDPTTDADIQAAIRLAQASNAANGDPSMLALIQSAQNPKPAAPAPEYRTGDVMGPMTAEGREQFGKGIETLSNLPPASAGVRGGQPSARSQQLASGLGNVLMGAGSTAYNALASAVPEALPSWLVGEPWQRKQLARDIAAMPDAFAGMGSAMVGPSYERAANLERRAMFPDLVEGAAPAAVQTAKGVLQEAPVAPVALQEAEMAPAMARNQRTGAEEPAPMPESFKVDNPAHRGNTSWLQGKVDRAEEAIAKAPPETASGKGLVGPATAYTRKPMDVSTDFLSKIPGANNERRIPGDPQYDELRSIVEKEGWDPTPILVQVNHRGQPYIVEGNTRVAVAKDLGIPNVPTDVRFLNGAEGVKGGFTPDVFAANAAEPKGGVIRSQREAAETPAVPGEVPAGEAAPAQPTVYQFEFPKSMKMPKLDPRDTNVMQRLGTTMEDQKLIADTIKRVRDNYHPRKGFDDFEVVGGKFENTRGGERIFVPQVREQKYGFEKPPEGMTVPQWTNRMANKVVNEVSRVVDRAKAGDRNAINIVREARWYRDMRARMRQEFGGLGDLFADLLGTTSAQTGVTQNWNNAIEILRRFTRGEYDREIAAYEQRLKNGESVNPIDLQRMFKAGEFPLITKATGELFNANSPAATRALLDMFRDIRAGVSPKTPNFTGNLIGYSNLATVDVWAARLLRRLAGKKPIPPAAEQAVTGKHAVGSTMDNPIITGEFGFGQNVFDRAKDIINRRGIVKSFDPSLGDLGADDLQAIAWFIEKEGWTNKGWTSKAGEGGSLDYEASLAGAADPQRVSELRKVLTEDFEPPKRRKKDTDEMYNERVEKARVDHTERQFNAQQELNQIIAPLDRYTLGISRQRPNQYPSNYAQAELAAPLDSVVRDDPSVIAYQLNNTIGRFMGENERALNAEFVVRSDFNPQELRTAMVQAGKEYDQDAVFMSKVLRSPTDSPNARPGIEIYFRNKLPQNVVEDISNEMTTHGVDGFTFVTDARQADRVNVQAGVQQPETAGLVGIRFQYIPEFDDAFVEANRAQIMADKQTAYEDIVAKMVQKYPQISTGDVVWYDTNVMFRGDYDAYLAGVGKARGGEVWQGQPYRPNAQGPVSRATGGKVGSGDLYHRISRAGGQDWLEADIQAALNTARHHRDDGGRLTANTDPLGYLPVTARPPEDRNVPVTISTAKGPYRTTQEDIDRGARRSQYLYENYVQPAIEGFTAIGDAYNRGSQGQIASKEQLISDALKVAGMTTLGSAAVPAEENALRIGFSGKRSKTADMPAIFKARDMHFEGATPEQIWEETGYFPHPGTGSSSPPMIRYDQPIGMSLDVAKIQRAPRYNTKYMLPDVLQEQAFAAGYPDLYQNTPVTARWRVGKQPEEGAGMYPMERVGSTITKPAEIFLGNVTDPGYQMTRGEVGSLAHELNHVIADYEGLPMALDRQSAPMSVMRRFRMDLADPRISPEERLRIQQNMDEFADLYAQNPNKISYALYLHDVNEAMSRTAEKLAAYPEMRQGFPLDKLDVNPDWLISHYRPSTGPSWLQSEPDTALQIARWASTPEGKEAMNKNARGEEMSISRMMMDPVSVALRIAKGNQP